MSMPTRDMMKAAFYDTLDFCSKDKHLQDAIKASIENSRVFHEGETITLPQSPAKQGNIRVFIGRTLESALWFAKIFPGKKIAVLNFANHRTPGGGVKNGSRAQEESLCRSSTLYASLDSPRMYDEFYEPHIENFSYNANDDCIYSPDVMICKDDSDYIPKRLLPEDFVTISVITCAAPKIHRDGLEASGLTHDKLLNIHTRRAEMILRVAAFYNTDIMITGAFGCGAFKAPPDIVAAGWEKALETYRTCFDYTAFAIYTNDHERNNFRAFRDEFMN